MHHYNAQRVKTKRHILDYMHQPYPCDTIPEGTHYRQWTSWTNFKAYVLNPNSPQDPYLYYALYDEQDVPQALHSRPILVNAAPAPKGKRARDQKPAPVQHQVEVAWKAAYYLPHHLPTIRLMGYTTASETLVTPDHTLAGNIPPLLRPLCTEQTPLICVTWDPREEHLEGLQANFGPLIDKLLTDFTLQQTRYEQQRQMETHPQYGMTAAEKQGIWDTTKPHTPSQYPLLGTKVTINTRPINPDMDIHPTLQITMESDPTYPQITHCYTPQGTYQGSINTGHLQTLAEVYTSLGGDPQRLPEQVLTLLLRTKRTPPKTSTITPPPIFLPHFWDTLWPNWVERFTTPLDHHPHGTPYASPYPEDTQWGSLGTPFSTPWEGVNFICPPNNASTLDKTIRWAIGSAMKSSQPTLNILYLPNVAGPHQAWINHPMVHTLAAIDLPPHTPNHSWNGHPPHTPTSKGGGTIYIIANIQGTQSHLLPQWALLTRHISPHINGTRRIRALPNNFGDPTRQGIGIQINGFQPPSSLNKCWDKLYPTTQSTQNTPHTQPRPTGQTAPPPCPLPSQYHSTHLSTSTQAMGGTQHCLHGWKLQNWNTQTARHTLRGWCICRRDRHRLYSLPSRTRPH